MESSPSYGGSGGDGAETRDALGGIKVECAARAQLGVGMEGCVKPKDEQGTEDHSSKLRTGTRFVLIPKGFATQRFRALNS